MVACPSIPSYVRYIVFCSPFGHWWTRYAGVGALVAYFVYMRLGVPRPLIIIVSNHNNSRWYAPRSGFSQPLVEQLRNLAMPAGAFDLNSGRRDLCARAKAQIVCFPRPQNLHCPSEQGT